MLRLRNHAYRQPFRTTTVRRSQGPSYAQQRATLIDRFQNALDRLRPDLHRAVFEGLSEWEFALTPVIGLQVAVIKSLGRRGDHVNLTLEAFHAAAAQPVVEGGGFFSNPLTRADGRAFNIEDTLDLGATAIYHTKDLLRAVLQDDQDFMGAIPQWLTLHAGLSSRSCEMARYGFYPLPPWRSEFTTGLLERQERMLQALIPASGWLHDHLDNELRELTYGAPLAVRLHISVQNQSHEEFGNLGLFTDIMPVAEIPFTPPMGFTARSLDRIFREYRERTQPWRVRHEFRDDLSELLERNQAFQTAKQEWLERRAATPKPLLPFSLYFFAIV